MSTLNFIWIRHCVPKVPHGYAYGAMEEVQLNTTGPKTLEAFQALAGLIPENAHIISSPSPRAKTTFEAVLGRQPEEDEIDKRFLEQNQGILEGRLISEVRDEAGFQAYLKNMDTTAIPQGESLGDMKERVLDGIQSLIQMVHLLY